MRASPGEEIRACNFFALTTLAVSYLFAITCAEFLLSLRKWRTYEVGGRVFDASMRSSLTMATQWAGNRLLDIPVFFGAVFEAGAGVQERQLDVADGAVALLGDDDFGEAFEVGVVFLVDL